MIFCISVVISFNISFISAFTYLNLMSFLFVWFLDFFVSLVSGVSILSFPRANS